MSSPRKVDAGPWTMELRVALETARIAAERARELYQEFVAVPDAPATISTAADKELQEIILEHLSASFPIDGFRAEEDTPTLKRLPKTADRCWIVDPIDGTRGFARKNGEFSVMIGLVRAGQPVVGVVAEPMANCLTYATVGGGCWRRNGLEVSGDADQPCRVSQVDEMAAATMLASHATKIEKSPLLQRAAHVRRSYSAGLKLALIARGEADLYWRQHLFHSWDVCAGHILVTEAGGTVMDAQGQPIHYDQLVSEAIRGILASNGRLMLTPPTETGSSR